jgi:putative oxidoreductase
MQSGPELRFVVEEQRTTFDVVKLWFPRVLLALVFVFIGLSKFNSDPRGEWFQIFAKIGLGQWFRYFTGAMQIMGALLMLTPWTLTVGAALLACTMIGAVVVDVFVAPVAIFAIVPLALLGMVVAVWFAGRFGVASGRN